MSDYNKNWINCCQFDFDWIVTCYLKGLELSLSQAINPSRDFPSSNTSLYLTLNSGIIVYNYNYNAHSHKINFTISILFSVF